MKYQPYFVDYHTHNERCGHAVGTIEQYIIHAIQEGFQEIGISDHFPLFHIPEERKLPQITMEKHQLHGYVEEVLKLQAAYKEQIHVKLGIEADYVPGWEEYLERELAQYPFDYVLGSVHFIGEWDHSDSRQVNQWQGRDIEQTYRDYYALIEQAAQSKLFDSLAHLDVIKRYNFLPDTDMTEIIFKALQAIKDADVCVEVNTSGEFMPVKEIFPSNEILQSCRQLEIPLTVGSDSHDPKRVGTNIKRIYRELLEMGFQEINGFAQRRRYAISLSGK